MKEKISFTVKALMGYLGRQARNPRTYMLPLCLCCCAVAFAAEGGGVGAVDDVATEISQYVPAVRKVIYAIAAVVAIIGAISVYVKMNNEEQDVKNILVLQNRQETRRKEMKLNSLLHNTLCRYFNFPIFENVVLKNI